MTVISKGKRYFPLAGCVFLTEYTRNVRNNNTESIGEMLPSLCPDSELFLTKEIVKQNLSEKFNTQNKNSRDALTECSEGRALWTTVAYGAEPHDQALHHIMELLCT